MRQLLTASKQQLLKQQLEHTFIPNTSPKQETATSTLKHELLYYLSTSSITPCNVVTLLLRIAYSNSNTNYTYCDKKYQSTASIMILQESACLRETQAGNMNNWFAWRLHFFGLYYSVERVTTNEQWRRKFILSCPSIFWLHKYN